MSDSGFLVEVGLSGFSGSSIASVAWPVQEAGQGRGSLEAVLVLANLLQAPFSPVGVDTASVGGRLACLPGRRVVRFQAARELELRRVYWNGIPGALIEHPEDAQVFVDLNITEAVIELSDDRLIHLRADAQGLHIEELTLAVQALVDVPAPQADVRAIADTWASEKVASHLSMHDGWHNAVAAGQYLRLRRINVKTEPPRVAVEKSWPHLWIRNLSDNQRATVSDRAVARLDGLWGELEALEETFDPESNDWRDSLVAWCRHRDDLEGVRVLLSWAGCGHRLEQVLAPFDAAASHFLRSVPVIIQVDDEQLWRAAGVNPLSWWTCIERRNAL